MKLGTKSILFGAHQFLLHPVFVAIAWIKLYGFPYDPRIWIAFFVHDLGYWGKPNIDGPEGEVHPELGANIMHLFDGWETKHLLLKKVDEWKIKQYVSEGWSVTDIVSSQHPIYKYDSVSFEKMVRKTYWKEFVLYHSRHYAKRDNAKPSKLCFADKLSFCITPQWLYLRLTNATGEILEYMKSSEKYYWKKTGYQKQWHDQLSHFMRNWIAKHIDGRNDTWTENRYITNDPLHVLREDTYSNS